MKLYDELKEVLGTCPEGIKASHLAERLGKTRHTVNKCLYKHLDTFYVDDKYYWFLRASKMMKDTEPSSIPVKSYEEIEEVDTILQETEHAFDASLFQDSL